MRTPIRLPAPTAALALAATLGACTTVAPSPAPPTLTAAAEAPAAVGDRAPVTILVSIDGFRPDYLHHGITPNLDRLAAAGVEARMQPSFPTLTFPNHYAMATGLRPDRTGMVENAMEDPTHPGPRFDIHDPKTSRDPFWWNEAEPIWVTAERAGIRTATMFWPGSDAAIRGTRPQSWFAYDADVSSAQRADALLDWARRPAATRPRLLALYFDVVDKASHSDGVGSAKVVGAIGEVDAQIGRLADGLAAMGRPADLIVVSDHGMMNVPPDHVLPLDSVIDKASMDVIANGGPVLAVWPLPGKDAEVAAALLRPRAHLACRRKEDLPPRWHFGANRRVPPFYCLAEPGWRYSKDAPKDHPIGDHGFDNVVPDMAALFIATGPAFRHGVHLATFDNVDVYPLVRQLIGLPPAANIDGTIAPLRAALR